MREERQLLQRQLAAVLEIDTPMYSKIERNDRRAKREQVIKLAALLHADKEELIGLWLADQVYNVIRDEAQGEKAFSFSTTGKTEISWTMTCGSSINQTIKDRHGLDILNYGK